MKWWWQERVRVEENEKVIEWKQRSGTINYKTMVETSKLQQNAIRNDEQLLVREHWRIEKWFENFVCCLEMGFGCFGIFFKIATLDCAVCTLLPFLPCCTNNYLRHLCMVRITVYFGDSQQFTINNYRFEVRNYMWVQCIMFIWVLTFRYLPDLRPYHGDQVVTPL